MRPRARILLVLLAFVALSLPVLRVGEPDTHARRAIAGLPETPAVAFLGDSRPHAGISPRILGEELAREGVAGVSAHTFAEDGTDMLHHHNLLATALLRRSPPPRVVVVAVNPLGFDATRKNNRLDRLDPAVLDRLILAGAPLETALDIGTMAVLPAYRSRPGAKERIEGLAEKAAFAFAARQTAIGLDFERREERRTYFPTPDGQASFVVDRDWQRGFELSRGGYRARYAKLVLGDFHLALARDMADLARAAGVVLVFLEMPVAPAYRTDFASLPVHLAWRERMRQIAREHGAVWLCHADLFDDDRAFGDPGHMQAPLAERYTRILAAALLGEPQIAAALRTGPRIAAALRGGR